MKDKMDLKVSGSSRIPGGEYGDVSVSGSLIITGGLKCENLHCSGSTRIADALDCTEELHSSGSLDIGTDVSMAEGKFSGSFSCGGDLSCTEELGVSGMCSVGGRAQVGEVHISGALDVGESLKAHSVHCSGKLNVSEDVEAEEFVSSGLINIEGLLNSEEVTIELGSSCCVGDMGGGSITVKKRWRGLGFGTNRPRLVVETVEGDEIHLEATHAETVRGKKVYIGKDCQIGCVEYSEKLTVDGGVVEEQIKI